MAKPQKPDAEPDPYPRRGLILPPRWMDVARAIADRRPMPLSWYFVDLIRREAEARGVTDLPPTLWGTDGGKPRPRTNTRSYRRKKGDPPPPT